MGKTKFQQIREKEWKRLMNKQILTLFAVLLLFSFVACSNTNNTEKPSSSGEDEDASGLSGELVIFNWTEYMPQEILDNFEKEFGVKVVYTTFASNQEMLAKVRSGTVAYDLAVPSDFYVQVMRDEGLLEEINFDNIPNFKNISADWKSLSYDPNNKYSVTYMYGFDGLLYNKEKIDRPTSWGDLWNPEYKGHVVIMDAADEINDMLQQYMGNDMNNPTEDQILEGGELLKELMPNILMFTEAPEATLVSGEAWLVYGYSGEAAVAFKENPAIDFVLPKEGGIRWTDNMVIPTTTQNKEAAEAFINYLLRPEVSKLLSEEFPYGNPNTKAVELLDEADINVPGLNLSPEQTEGAVWSEVLDAERTQVVNRVIQEAKIKAGQ